jgi:hydrogenase nickel incorporation protein HypA/HybF
MHELSIVQGIVEGATAACGDRRVLRIVVEIGCLNAVLPDALLFCFDLATKGTLAEGAELAIVEVPAAARCEDCGKELATERGYTFERCRCGSGRMTVVRGNELRIKEMEVV